MRGPLAICVAAFVLAVTADASAEESTSPGTWELTLGAGYGRPRKGSDNPYGLGGSLRAAYLFASGAEVGLRGDGFLGDGDSNLVGSAIEVAWSGRLARTFWARGSIGLGVSVGSARSDSGRTYFVPFPLVLPELGVRWVFAPPFVVGVDLDYFVIAGAQEGSHGLVGFATLGVRPEF